MQAIQEYELESKWKCCEGEDRILLNLRKCKLIYTYSTFVSNTIHALDGSMIQSIMKINTININTTPIQSTKAHSQNDGNDHSQKYLIPFTHSHIPLPSPPREAFIPSSTSVNNTNHVLDTSVTQLITNINTMIHLPPEQCSATNSAYLTYISDGKALTWVRAVGRGRLTCTEIFKGWTRWHCNLH
jgi:hypothetical protein